MSVVLRGDSLLASHPLTKPESLLHERERLLEWSTCMAVNRAVGIGNRC